MINVTSRIFFLLAISFSWVGVAQTQESNEIKIISWSDLDQNRISHFRKPNYGEDDILRFTADSVSQIPDPYIRAQAETVSNQIRYTINSAFANMGFDEDRFRDGYNGHNIRMGFSNSGNASAAYDDDGEPILVIDPNWLGITDEKVRGCVCSSQAMGVIAHELAHLLLNHLKVEGLEWEKEFEADYWSGRGIYKYASIVDIDGEEYPEVGITIKQFGDNSPEYQASKERAILSKFAEAMFVFADKEASELYPSRKDRVLRFLQEEEEEGLEIFNSLDFEKNRPAQVTPIADSFFNLLKKGLGHDLNADIKASDALPNAPSSGKPATTGWPKLVKRATPDMPESAQQSGCFVLSKDVTPEGIPINVSLDKCSEDIFMLPSVEAIRKWRYTSESQEPGKIRQRIKTYIKFHLLDENSEVIPPLGGVWPPPVVEPSGPVSSTSLVVDRDVLPLVRIPPIFPPRFLQGDNSGYCKVRFDVSPEGEPINIKTTICTSRQLERATMQSMRKWKYNPKIVDGLPVARNGVESTVKFDLQDELGRKLPLPKGY